MKPELSKEKPILTPSPRQTWQDYQAELKRRNIRKRHTRRLVRCVMFLLVLAASLYGLSVRIDGFSGTPKDFSEPKPSLALSDPSDSQANKTPDLDIKKNNWTALWRNPSSLKEIRPQWTFHQDGKRFSVETTLNASLQHFLNDKIDRKLPKQVAVVVVEPSTGRILALAGHDRINPTNNPCLKSDFPAASIFKIVTASAAVEKHAFKPETSFFYNGQKHTLYKSQLKNTRNKYSHWITLRDSFAQSINPIFGKLGIYHLDMSEIENYARAFGFGEEIEFELGKFRSSLFVSEEPYHLAEIASGFNRKTTLSPLHGALIASAVLNGGRFMSPSLIDRVTNGDGETVYQGHTSQISQAISPSTASVLSDLMQATIRSGTSRRAFSGYRYDKVLSKLIIGGKTGSISNITQTSKYDWFVGFAKEKGRAESIAVSVLVVHGETLSRRAGSYARMAIKAYYEEHFNGKSAVSNNKRRS